MALGDSNYLDAIWKHVDNEAKGVAKCDPLGGIQQMSIINESGESWGMLFSRQNPANES